MMAKKGAHSFPSNEDKKPKGREEINTWYRLAIDINNDDSS